MHPKVYDIVRNDVYVDDRLSGKITWDELLLVTDQLKIVLSRGGFALGVTIAGRNTPGKMASNGQSINEVVYWKWSIVIKYQSYEFWQKT